jgi:plastocyanin
LLALIPFAMQDANAAAISGRVVGPDGKGIPQAVVFVQSPAPAETAGAGAPAAAEMNQIGRTFVPHVLPVTVGTLVHFPNYDQIHHHVYSFSRVKTFELPLYRGESAKPVLFDKPGVVKLGCNIHDWMSGIILVLPTRYFATTDEEGRYTLSGLSPGEYTLTAWHAQSREKTDDLARPVHLAGLQRVENFELSLTEARDRPAKHGARADP